MSRSITEFFNEHALMDQTHIVVDVEGALDVYTFNQFKAITKPFELNYSDGHVYQIQDGVIIG